MINSRRHAGKRIDGGASLLKGEKKNDDDKKRTGHRPYSKLKRDAELPPLRGGGGRHHGIDIQAVQEKNWKQQKRSTMMGEKRGVDKGDNQTISIIAPGKEATSTLKGEESQAAPGWTSRAGASYYLEKRSADVHQQSSGKNRWGRKHKLQ